MADAETAAAHEASLNAVAAYIDGGAPTLPDRWLVATSERVLFTLDTGLPTAVTPYWVTNVRPLHNSPGTLISFSGDSPIIVTDDFATVMDRLSGKRT